MALSDTPGHTIGGWIGRAIGLAIQRSAITDLLLPRWRWAERMSREYPELWIDRAAADEAHALAVDTIGCLECDLQTPQTEEVDFTATMDKERAALGVVGGGQD